MLLEKNSLFFLVMFSGQGSNEIGGAGWRLGEDWEG